MGDVTLRPGCWANILTGPANSTPVWLPHLLECETATTLAAAVGDARLTFADPDGRWAATFKPNDIVRIVFASRRRQTLAQHGPTPSWSGLVNACYQSSDPRAPYGRACTIEASTFWKAFLITSVPFYRISKPRGGLTNVQLIAMALDDVRANTGLALNFTAVPSLAQQIPFWNLPSFSDFLAPALTSWASYLTANALMAGNELFFNEAGNLILQETQFARSNVPDVVLNAEDLYALQAGVTDDGLVTNAVVTYTMVPTLANAGLAPGPTSEGPGGVNDIGVLPPSLRDANGKPLRRLGQRFEAVYVPWLNDQTAAARYAAVLRTIGLASVNQALATIILNGDLTVGQLVQIAGNPAMRYYLTSVQHQWMLGQDAATQITLRYGLAAGQSWDRAQLASYSTAGLAIPPTATTGGATPALPALGNNPGVALASPSLTYADIGKILAAKGSPFTDQAQYIWQLSQRYGIDPAFALAVWQQECQLGTDPAAVTDLTDHNPGSLGVTSSAGGGGVYATWAAGILAWYQFIADHYLKAGISTVQDIGATYAADPNWGTNVAAIMASFRQNYLAAARGVLAQAQGALGAAPGAGQAPSGWPFRPANMHYGISQGYGPTTYTGEPSYDGYAHFHRGIDITCPSGTPLYATTTGTLQAGVNALGSYGYGFLLVIQSGPYNVLYGHCSGLAPGVQSGQEVNAGDLIGFSGGDPALNPTYAGNSTGAHLHYEIDTPRLFAPTNPMPFLAG